MKIRVNVDQAACLAAGLDAPQSIAHIDIKPAELAPEIRQYLAQQLENGIGVGLTFAKPDPRQEDVVAAVTKKVQEIKHIETLLNSQLSPQEQAAFQKGRLAPRALMEAAVLAIQPVLKAVFKVIRKPGRVWIIETKEHRGRLAGVLEKPNRWETEVGPPEQVETPQPETGKLNAYCEPWLKTISALEKIEGVTVTEAWDGPENVYFRVQHKDIPPFITVLAALAW